MGGGTGTGASPVIAQVAKENGTLVVAVATKPFLFEGHRRITQALEGIDNLRSNVDALIVIPNDRLLEITQKETTLLDAFRLADDVLRQAVQGVTDLILRPGLVNVDFADVRTIMMDAGTAIMGIGEAKGDGRASKAAHAAINSPLMDGPITGARGVLFNVTGGPNLGIHEIQEAAQVVTEAADPKATILWGHVLDPELDEKVQITVIATGFASGQSPRRPLSMPGRSGTSFIETEALPGRGVLKKGGKDPGSPPVEVEDLDTPPEIRRRKFGHQF
jgi:cell division protein FtsZ